MKTSLLMLIGVLASCSGEPPKATAYQITNEDQLIGGPGALGAIGDWKLENDKIEVIVHGPDPNRGLLIYGGSIIDADLRRPGKGGRDILGEVTPTFLLESFIPDSYEIVSDGSDGDPAILRVMGDGGDLLQAAQVVNTALLLPQSLEFQIDYILEPGSHMVKIETTVRNTLSGVRDFPALPTEDILAQIGATQDLNIEFAVPLGHMLLFGRKAFATGATGFNNKFGIRKEYPKGQGLPGFPGIVTEYFARSGDGVSYGFAVPDADYNFVGTFASQYPEQHPTAHSLVIPFQFAGATVAFHATPPKTMAGGQEFTYTGYLIVGDGDIASVSDKVYALHDQSVGTLAGQMLDAQTLKATDGQIVVRKADTGFVTVIEPDPEGFFSADLPPGDYLYNIVSDGRLTTEDKQFAIKAGEVTQSDELLPPLGRVLVNVFDEKGRAMPCKVTLVGEYDPIFSGMDPREFLYDLRVGESIRPTDFEDSTTRFIESVHHVADGALEITPRPGTYTMVVSRGPEYELAEVDLTVVPGKRISQTVVLPRAFDSAGYISMDSHLHSQNSMDSDLDLHKRVTSIAAEGVEFAVATDHNFITDYGPYIRRLNLQEWLLHTTGLEVTSYEMGHFNGYPLKHDPGSVRGGEVLWAGKTPDEIFDRIREIALHGAENVIVQVNHARGSITGYFNAYNFDQDVGNIVPHSGAAIFRASGPEFDQSNFSLDFDAMELINGKRLQEVHTARAPDPLPPGPFPDGTDPMPGEPLRDEDGEIEFPGMLEDWFSLLNRGHVSTGVGTSDSHSTTGQEPGYARTYVWVGEDKDEIGQFRDVDVVAGLKSRRAIVSNGPFVEFFIGDTPIGGLAQDAGNTVTLRVVGKTASWAPIDRVIVYANGQEVARRNLSGAERISFDIDIPVQAASDSWFVIEARGDTNMFPVLTPQEFEPFDPNQLVDGLLNGVELGTTFGSGWGELEPKLTFAKTPWAITNPIWADVDGDGQFTTPQTPLTSKNPGKDLEGSVDIYEWFQGVSQ